MRIDVMAEPKVNIDIKCKVDNKNKASDALNDVLPENGQKSIMTNTMVQKKGMLSGLSKDGSIEELKKQAETVKDNLSAIFTKMDTGKAVKMESDGIDVNNTEVDKVVSVVERIQIKLAMFCDNFEPTVNINLDDISSTIGNGAMAYDVAARLKENSITPTKDNVSDVLNALQTVQNTGKIDDGTRAYLIKNNMKPSIENVYIASHAGNFINSKSLSDVEWEEIKPQAEKLISDSGMEINEHTLNSVQWMLNNNIDATTDNLNKLFSLYEIPETVDTDSVIDRIAATLVEGENALDTLVTGESLPWEETEMAITTIQNATPGNVMALVSSQKEFTLDNLSDVEISNEEVLPDNNYKYTKATRELQEIRLMMTIDAGRTLEKNGISINTVEISELVDKLKEYEKNVLQGEVNKNNDNSEVTIDDVNKVIDINVSINNLKYAPCAVISTTMEESQEPSVNNYLKNIGITNARLDKAGYAYEALSTEVRSDLGDSVNKAIKASTQDILSNLGYEDNEENRRAVRILAYNEMEFNEKNIDKVKALDFSANQLFKNMSPKTTLKMLREGINPLETNIEELNEYFNKEKSSETNNIEKYSEFLYRMDKQGNITKEEREKFIGIYSLINKFEKDGMNAAGIIADQNLEFNMGNLLTAYMTRKDKNIELKADENTGVAEVSDKVTYYKNLLASISDKVTPEKLKEVSNDIDNMSIEEFTENMNQYSEEQEDEYSRYMDTIRETSTLENSIVRLITDNDIPVTFNNLLAAKTIIKNPNKIFTDDKPDISDEFIEALDSKDDLQKVYEGISQSAKDVLEKSLYKEDSYVDMDSLRQLGNEMSLLNSLAKRNTYYIPYKNEDRTGVINLKVIEDSENAGSFSIKINDERYGNISVNGKINGDELTAQLLGDTNEGIEFLQISEHNIENELNNSFKEVRLYVNKAKEQPETKSEVKNNIETSKLFSTAKMFIVELTK